MRWNCPHCGTSLAVSDEKMSAGWSFSRCYKCAGFALVRRSDVNLIKVDRAPAGEPILLPEANESPTSLLSQTATQNLAKYISSGATPTIRPATRRETAQAAPTAPTPSPPLRRGTPNLGFLPPPLPDDPKPGIAQRLTPVAIGMTGFLAIGSGVYLYIQGQALWQKARLQASERNAQAPVQEPKSTAATATIDESAEIVQAPTFASTAGSARPDADSARREITDQVHAHAMAPARDAPQPAEQPKQAGHKMNIEVLTDRAHIHSGPGLGYPVIGTVNIRSKYAVEEWDDRWFKINLEEHAPRKPAQTSARIGWISSDHARPSP